MVSVYENTFWWFEIMRNLVTANGTFAFTNSVLVFIFYQDIINRTYKHGCHIRTDIQNVKLLSTVYI